MTKELSVILQTGRVKDEALEIWQECPWGGHFPVKWHLVVDVPGTFFEHILLTNNDRKPVTVSRDMQEVRRNCHGVVSWF